ncbi:SMI1/KNR4 family protein [Burkholderia pyrrocinia]|nr:SMI1/KNR4 family protein [Burkholderia pyrrocinia]
MTENLFFDCEKEIDPYDLETVELKIGARLPEELKRHYLKFNGGHPKRRYWNDPQMKFDALEVAGFRPIRYCKADHDNPRSLLDGGYLSLLERAVIPRGLLPFARDIAGNFFCVDLAENDVWHFAADAFDPDASPSENHTNARRRLVGTFQGFIDELVSLRMANFL